MTLSKSRTTFVTWTHTLVCLSGVLSPVCNGNISITRPPTLSHIFNIITRTWSSSSVSEPPVLLLLHLPITYIFRHTEKRNSAKSLFCVLFCFLLFASLFLFVFILFYWFLFLCYCSFKRSKQALFTYFIMLKNRKHIVLSFYDNNDYLFNFVSNLISVL